MFVSQKNGKLLQLLHPLSFEPKIDGHFYCTSFHHCLPSCTQVQVR